MADCNPDFETARLVADDTVTTLPGGLYRDFLRSLAAVFCYKKFKK